MPALGPSFRRLWIASATSNVADGVFSVALPLLAVQVTDRPALVAGVALAQRLPWLVLVLPAGALADRLDRRRTMVRVDVLRVVVMGGLAVGAGLDAVGLPLLYLAAFALGVGETLFDTAAQSILPSLVDRDRLSVANGRLQAVELAMNQFVGPPLGGLLAAATLAAAFAASSAAYLVAAVALAAIAGSFRPVTVTPAASLRRDIAEGLRFLWRNPLLRTLAVMLGGANLASSAHGAVFVLFAVDPGPMGLSPQGFGLLFASGALGGVVASSLVGRAERVLGRARCLLGSMVLFGGALAVPAVTSDVAPNVAAFVAASFGILGWNVITVSLRQRVTPDHLLGRMNAAYRMVGWGTMPLGAALGGALAEGAGLRAAFVTAALLHVPLLLGFLVVTERRIGTAEQAAAVAA